MALSKSSLSLKNLVSGFAARFIPRPPTPGNLSRRFPRPSGGSPSATGAGTNLAGKAPAGKYRSSKDFDGAKGGYTLVEVLVSVTIVSIALTGLVSVLAVGSRQSSQASNKGAATHEATELLEKLRASVAANMSDLPGGPSGPAPPPNLYNPPWHAGCDNDTVNYNPDGSVALASLDVVAGNAGCDHVFFDQTGDTFPTTHYLQLNSPYFSADFRSKYQGNIRYWVWDNGLADSPSRYKVQVVIDWQEATLQAGG